jgi:hypothetical protein
VTGIHADIAAWLGVRLTEREERAALNPSARSRRETLADCHSKRVIISWCLEVISDRDLFDYGACLQHDPNPLAVTLAVETLRALTMPFQEYDGYRAEWRQVP